MIALYISVLLISLYWLFLAFKKEDKFAHIHGPKGLPILGNAHQLDTVRPHIHINELSKKYGDVFKMNIAGNYAIVVSGYKSLHRMLVSNGRDFDARPTSFRSQTLSGGNSDVASANMEPKFHLIKKLILQHVRSNGAGIHQSENIVTTVMGDTIQEVKEKYAGVTVDIKTIVRKIIIDITYLLTFSKLPNEEETKVIDEVIHYVSIIGTVGAHGEIFDRFPWIRYFGHPIWKQLVHMEKLRSEQYLKWKSRASEDLESGDIDGKWPCTILKTIAEDTELGLTDIHADLNIWEMFFGGVTSSSALVTSMFNILAHHRTVQKKLQEEVDHILQDEVPTFENRRNMPYHMATVFELLRYCSVLPFLLPHQTSTDTVLNDIKIPKGTQIWPNVWGLHHDEKIWGDPFTFRPGRYLDEEGALVLADHPSRKHNLSFGAGVRVCAGEVFALTRIFMILVMFMQHFDVGPATSLEEQPSCDCREMQAGLVLYPRDFKVRLTPRK